MLEALFRSMVAVYHTSPAMTSSTTAREEDGSYFEQQLAMEVGGKALDVFAVLGISSLLQQFFSANNTLASSIFIITASKQFEISSQESPQPSANGIDEFGEALFKALSLSGTAQRRSFRRRHHSSPVSGIRCLRTATPAHAPRTAVTS